MLLTMMMMMMMRCDVMKITLDLYYVGLVVFGAEKHTTESCCHQHPNVLMLLLCRQTR